MSLQILYYSQSSVNKQGYSTNVDAELSYNFQKQMHLKVQQAIDSIKSSILTSTRQQFHKSKEQQNKKNKVWAGIEDGLKIFKLHRRFLVIQFSFTVSLAAYFLLLFTYYECDFEEETTNVQWFLWGIMATSIPLVFASVIRYKARVQIAQARREKPTTLLEIGIEVLVIMLQPYPHLNEDYIKRISLKNEELLPLKLNHILLLFALTKLVLLIRGILNYLTPYAYPRNFRLTKMYGVLNNHFYHLRCLFRQHPVFLISSLYLFCMGLFAYCYRVFENGAAQTDITFGNTLWLALLTMTTVGYGDVRPITRLGGMVTVVCSYAGVIGTSLFVLSITTNLELNYWEERALMILKRLKKRRELKAKSALFIRICLWRLWLEYKNRSTGPITAKQRQMKRELAKLSQQQKNSLKQTSLFQQVMQQQFEIVKLNIDSILENCSSILQECSKKQQFIEGVLRNLEEQKQGLKVKVNGKYMSVREKTLRQLTGMAGSVSHRVSCYI